MAKKTKRATATRMSGRSRWDLAERALGMVALLVGSQIGDAEEPAAWADGLALRTRQFIEGEVAQAKKHKLNVRAIEAAVARAMPVILANVQPIIQQIVAVTAKPTKKRPPPPTDPTAN